MTQKIANRLDTRRKLLLGDGGDAVAVPVGFGLIKAPQSRQDKPAAQPGFDPAS